MTTTELTHDERRVLLAVKTVHDRDLPPTTHIIAELVGSTFRPTRRVINRLMERGLLTASLALTQQGADVAAEAQQA